MITVTSQISTQDITISSQVGKATILAVDPITLGELHVGQLPSVTVSDPGLAQRVTDLEEYDLNGTINGGTIF